MGNTLLFVSGTFGSAQLPDFCCWLSGAEANNKKSAPARAGTL